MADFDPITRILSNADAVPISLDEKGHLENTTCTWAPPAEHTIFTFSAKPIQETRRTPAVVAMTSPGEGTKVESPMAEYFPALYYLPCRTSNFYEVECTQDHGSEVCSIHNQGVAPTPEQQVPSNLRKLRGRTSQSWSMEEQKKFQHVVIINDWFRDLISKS
ncbi:hypothetical protein BDZ91DRAFT_720106 [Kalaharituber pfeilii]|nr:hypothetical protein BDZ91DRAFT_720106 [Kalaharituber pfeilii]